jgi:hypothetical protein
MNYLAGGVNLGNSLFGGPHFLTDKSGVGTLTSIFLSNSIIIAGVILIFLLIFAGISVVGGAGNPQKVQAAMKLATYGVGGFLLVFATYFIIKIIEQMTGLSILQ